VRNTTQAFFLSAGTAFLFAGICAAGVGGTALEQTENGAPPVSSYHLPASVGEDDYAALRDHSPFLRPLDLSKTLVLTGLAQVDGQFIATVRNRETKEAHIVSSADATAQGWRLVRVEGNQADLQSVSAQISVTGGEIVSLRFDEAQLNPGAGSVLSPIPADQARRIAEQARNYRNGIESDGFSGAPPKEVVEKLSRLSEDQRGRIIYEVGQMRARGASSEERRNAFTRMLDRALGQGR